MTVSAPSITWMRFSPRGRACLESFCLPTSPTPGLTGRRKRDDNDSQTKEASPRFLLYESKPEPDFVVWFDALTAPDFDDISDRVRGFGRGAGEDDRTAKAGERGDL